MNQDWLSPLRAALAAGDHTIQAFCRDDDVGWSDNALWPLIDTLECYEVPLDMAIIPAAVSEDLVQDLVARMRDNDRLHLHQHGFRHHNHQSRGRKCEFGDERDPQAQADDIRAGADRLQTWFGARFEPIFTPPWNRCDQSTINALREQGFKILSRSIGAKPLQLDGLIEISVSIDWCQQRDGARIGLFDLANQLAGQIRTGKTLGLMFHHAVMDSYDLGAIDEVLALLSQSGRLRWCGMLELAGVSARPAAVANLNGHPS